MESHFNKITGLYLAISLKERTPIQVFLDEFYKILKKPFFTEHLQATISTLWKKYFIKKIKKYLHLGQKIVYLVIFGLEFEKAIVIFEINALKFV